jgi:MtfA peptidase
MPEIYFLCSIIIAVLIYIYPGWRDKRILKQAFPERWFVILNRQLPYFYKLTEDEQNQLKDLILLFIVKKKFYGCGGLTINDNIRVTIAAEACLLLLNRKISVYPRLKHILVYPDAFETDHQQHNDDGTVSNGSRGLLGESWNFGKVILSWDDVVHGVSNIHDGHNVALHEFSHQLDSESGSANGAPLLRKNSYSVWSKVLSKEFLALTKAFEHHHKSVMDYYGASNPAEFFAVATETFFEKPEQMQKKHPELFDELKIYYAVNPILWQ